jgi:hypothetical protein
MNLVASIESNSQPEEDVSILQASLPNCLVTSDLLGLDWTGSGLKSSPRQFYRDLAPGAPYNPYTIYSKS